MKIDLDILELVALAPESEPAEVTMVTDPQVMAQAYPLLVREGLGFWPRESAQEAAWRMLSIDLQECLAYLDDGQTNVELVVIAGVAGVMPIQRT